MTEGDETPKFTWTVTEGNLLDGDALEGSLKASQSGPGKYPIMQDTPFENPNYEVTFLPGSLTVAERSANPQTGEDFPAWAFWMSLLALVGIGSTLLSARRRKAKER